MGRLKRTYETHLEAFRNVYGVSSPLAISVDVAVVLVGIVAWLFATGPVKWIGLLVALGSAVGLASRAIKWVRA